MLTALLFPPVCVDCRRLLAASALVPLCTTCRSTLAPLPRSAAWFADVYAPYPFDGPFTRAVTRLKDRGDTALAGPLGRLLAATLAAEPRLDADVIIPVPLHRKRHMRRGFNQAELLAESLARDRPPGSRPRTRIDGRALRRVRDTPAQRGLDGRRRRANLVGAFEARAQRVRGRDVLVVDDVTTTGATMAACFSALRVAGARSVRGVALLRALDDRALPLAAPARPQR